MSYFKEFLKHALQAKTWLEAFGLIATLAISFALIVYFACFVGTVFSLLLR
jgi:hypothetical protein